jgi:hypothetical protein
MNMWVSLSFRFNNGTFYSTFQNAVTYPHTPLKGFDSMVFQGGRLFEEMLSLAANGTRKATWSKITKKQLALAEKFMAHNQLVAEGKYFDDFDNDDDDVEDEDEDEDEDPDDPESATNVRLDNKRGGFRLTYLKVGDFALYPWYPHQLRVKANTAEDQLEIYIFRFRTSPLSPALARQGGMKQSKQLAQHIMKEASRFEVSNLVVTNCDSILFDSGSASL